MEPYIVEAICKPASRDSHITFCHATVCAISDTPENAEAMARNLIMSYSWLVESVECVDLKSSLPLDDSSTLDELLHQKAQQRKPPCALQFYASSDKIDSDQIVETLKTPERQTNYH